MNLIYIDTNVVIDALEDRNSSAGRDLGTSAMSVFSQALACRFDIVISKWMLEELKDHVEPKEVRGFFKEFREEDKVVTQSYTQKDKEKAEEIADHWQDALHGILAKKAGADCIVTRNIDDFRLFTSLNAKLPEYI